MNRHDQSSFDKEEIHSTDRPRAIDVPQEGLLQIVWRRHWIVLLAVIVTLLAGLVYLSKATPIYSSTSCLYVEQSGPKIISEQEGVMTQSKNYLYTQCGLLTSTPILAAVIEKPEISRLKIFAKVDNPIVFLKKKIGATVGKKDDIIGVSLESADPKETAQIVNAVVDSYITYHATSKRSTASEVLKILQNEKDKRDTELDDKYQTILNFKKENSDLTLEDQRGNIMIQGLAKLLNALTEARIETINAKAGYEAAKLMSNDPAKLRQLIEVQHPRGLYSSINQEENQLRTQINLLQLQLMGLRGKINADHPTVKTTEDKMTQIRNQLVELDKKSAVAYLEVTRQQWIATQQKETELQAAVDEQREEAQELNIKAAQYDILQSNLKRTENLCDILDSRIKELNVTEDVGALNISILEVARPADKPCKPQRARIMAMALVLGLMFGVGSALLLDFTDHRLRSTDEIAAVLGVPILGTVPSMKGKKDFIAHGLAVHQDPTSNTAEAYKTIRTAVYFGVPNGKAKSILVTSPTPGDGKTTLVSNLATAMAQAGQRSLVIDCDFRKPRQHVIFETEQEPGLSSILAGQQKLDEVIKRTSEDNLDIIPCGPIPINPSELLNSEAFADIIKELSGKYDRLLIDSPPVMPVSDARILGAMCDVTLLVLRAEKSTRKAGEQARDGLLSVGANILGVVVNDVHHGKGRYGYYGGYGYGYGYGYGRSRHEEGTKEKTARS